MLHIVLWKMENSISILNKRWKIELKSFLAELFIQHFFHHLIYLPIYFTPNIFLTFVKHL